MTKIPTSFMPEAADGFRAWIADVALDGVDPTACLREAIARLGEQSDPARYGHHYELGPRYARSGRPEVFWFDPSEIAWTETDEL